MSPSYKVSYVGDGATTNYAVVPDYIRKNHIFVTLDGVATSAYTFFNDQTIQFNVAPGLGVVIEIVRRPPGDVPLNTFTGTVITPTALNENFRQSTQLGTIFQDDAETAITTSQAAVATANAATSTANAADAAATQAAIDAAAAVVTANQADIDATAAVATANQADIDASAAVVTANLAAGDAAAAVITANTAESNSVAAVSTANSAAAAVSAAVFYAPVVDLAALALLTPADGEFFELQDSTGADTDPSITGIPGGLTGDSGLVFRLRYDDPPGEYVFLGYFSSDSETRYLKTGTGTVTSTNILDGTIVDADINASAAIVDTKLATIATAGKVSNSATTATNANTASAIVARDASGDFTAGTITADLTGNADTATALETARDIGGVSFDGTADIDLPGVNTTGNQDTTGNAATATKLDSSRTFAVTGDVTGTVSSDLTSGASIATSIASGVIVDGDVNASAAIAGTKIDPDFGSQTVETTGVFSAAGGAEATPSITFTGDLNTGIFSPGADQVAISTNGTERMRITSTGDIRFNSGYGSVATVYGCRAWVNFDGSAGSGDTIRGSGNVSSVTRIATGQYTINFATAMPDVNYNYAGGSESATDSTSAMHDRLAGAQLYSTTQFSLRTSNSAGAINRSFISACFFR